MNVGDYQITMFDLNGEDKRVRRITYDEAKPFLLNVHYARRMCNIMYAFGLFINNDLVGCVTYGVPASPFLCQSIAGEDNRQNVLELNRLVILPEYNGGGKNLASFLVSHSLKMLPNKTFVVSYSDTAWGHIGYVYQATNWLYTGLSVKRTDTYQPNGLHPRNYDKNNHSNLRQTRSRKHRYIYLVGDKKTKKEMRKELKYKVYDKYPKGNTKHYDIKNPTPIEKIKIIGG